jgi:hypothetical protein
MPTIASSTSSPHRSPPGDADLQELYDQVLSAFAEESSPSNFSPTYSINRPNDVVDHDPPYSPHSDQGISSLKSPRPHPQSRGKFPFRLSFSISVLHLPLSSSQPPRQQPALTLSYNLSYFSHSQQEPSPLTQASCHLYHLFYLPFSYARGPTFLSRPHPLRPDWCCQAWRRTVRHSLHPSCPSFSSRTCADLDDRTHKIILAMAPPRRPPLPQNALVADYLPIPDLPTRHKQHCVPKLVAAPICALPLQLLGTPTLVARVLLSILCLFLITLLRSELVVNNGAHPQQGGITLPMMFNLLGAQCKSSCPTDHLARLRPEFLDTLQLSTTGTIS